MTRKRWHRCTHKIAVPTPALARSWRALAVAAITFARSWSEGGTEGYEALRRAYGRVAQSGPIGIDIPLNSCLKLRKTVANAIFPREVHSWTPEVIISLGEQVITDCDLVIEADAVKRAARAAERKTGEARP